MPLHWITSPEDVADARRRRDQIAKANRQESAKDLWIAGAGLIIIAQMLALLIYVIKAGC